MTRRALLTLLTGGIIVAQWEGIRTPKPNPNTRPKPGTKPNPPPPPRDPPPQKPPGYR